MSDLSIELHWQRKTPVFATGTYSNSHIVQMNRLHEIDVDSAPDWGGDPAHTNPEQALASALSSCHMMTFLALAAKAGWPVASYHDYAEAHLGKTPKARCPSPALICIRSCALIRVLRWPMRNWQRCRTARIAIALLQIPWRTAWKSISAKSWHRAHIGSGHFWNNEGGFEHHQSPRLFSRTYPR